MRPRNEYERHIVELSQQLPPISIKQKLWAFEHCFEQDGFFAKGFVWCLHCGCEFQHPSSELGISVAGDSAVCPRCGKTLKLHNSRKANYEERWYYTIITTFKGYQVCRHFIATKSISKVSKYPRCSQEPHYTINEVVQNWIDENGRETIIARPCKCIPRVYDAWDYNKPMEIRIKRDSWYYSGSKYEIESKYIYPSRNVLPVIKRNGYKGLIDGIPASELFKLLIRDREAEVLAKNKQYEILLHKWRRGVREFKLPFQHSLRIANRNKYIVKDASLWFDYLYLLEYFRLDTHNAHYVCPKRLKAEHDRLLAKKQRIEERIEEEKRIAEAKEWEELYKQSKSKFFGICFGNENIVITVIQSVAEMAEEGKAMHHCVFSMEYYKKPGSLILSAKDKAGNRIETIEVDINTYKVVQSRGVCNENTDRHNEIIQLVNDNMNLIKTA